MPAPEPPVQRPAGDAPTWKPHKCKRSVFPPPERVTYAETPGEYEGLGRGDGNHTADEKLAAINKKRKSIGVCDTRHVDSVEASILRVTPPAPKVSRRASTATGYDNVQLVRSALALTPAEEKRLATDGLVVPERLGYDNFTTAYYDVHRAQLPVYVSVDSIMHAVFASHAMYLEQLEETQLVKRLDKVLGEMHCGLAAAAKQYPTDVANDIDLYLTVARSLLAQEPVLSELGKVDERAAELVSMVTYPTTVERIELFGRYRALDTTSFTPRGHYADSLGHYFRAAMWLSRVDLNLVSRDTRASEFGYDPNPEETPREAIVALSLADLAQRTHALDDISVIDRAWRVIAGAREDVTFADLVKLRQKAKIGALRLADAPALRAAIGDGYKRTVNITPTPNVPRLPVISTMLGPRITPDTVAVGALIEDRSPRTSAPELGFMLGIDRARTYIKSEPGIDKQLADARMKLVNTKPGEDLYSAWLAAIRALAIKPAGTTPSFMDGAPFQDMRLNSVLTAYGQLRHNHVLVAATAYDQGGCEIPDGYVEPAPDTYASLAEYAKRAAKTFREIDPKAKGIEYFTRLEKLMRVLVAISREELAGKPLSADTKRFLAMIVERRVASQETYGGSFPLATFDGWYLDLFPNMDTALKDPTFIADWATYDRDGQQGVHYLGAHQPTLGVFVVDTGGPARLMVGPVATAFQHTGQLETRLTDYDATSVNGTAPWAKSYTVAANAFPDFKLQFTRLNAVKGDLMPRAPDEIAENTIRIDAKAAHGDATVELLDHHFVKMTEVPITIMRGRVEVKAPSTPRPIESLRVRFKTESRRYDLPLDGHGGW